MTNTTQHPHHSKLTGLIWSIANGLRGTYRPPQYRRVMLPLIVLARFDAILSPHSDEMANLYKRYLEDLQKLEDEEKKIENSKSTEEIDEQKKILKGKKKLRFQKFEKDSTSLIVNTRKQTLYNTSGFNLSRLIDDPDRIAQNLTAYIQGFSPKAKDIFDKFKFEDEIAKLDEANRLFIIIKNFINDIKANGLSFSPNVISNNQMGYIFEELIRKFNEQANEEAGDHFTPREVINLMVNIIFEEDQNELIKPSVYRTIYDPTAGTGGMLSEAERHLLAYNSEIKLGLFGQEYNGESYAICCADLLIKDEPAENIIYGDTLGVANANAKDKGNGFVPNDGHKDKKFDYMFANPPFGVEWKNQEDYVKQEYNVLGFSGRFGAGLPRINDGSLLFLQHMMSKMKSPADNDNQGSRIAVIFNGSPLFTGDAGSGESNIRRYVIENDLLEAVIALPDQLFYNTGIYTYLWILSNKKSQARQGKIQLIDATSHFQKMAKSLGNKRNELSSEHIADITKIYADFEHNGTSAMIKDKHGNAKICSKIFDNREFGYLKIVVECPLRLNFLANDERIDRLWEQSAFVNLAKSKKIKDETKIKAEQAEGEALQQNIIDALKALDEILYKDRDDFLKVLNPIIKPLGLSAPVKKAILEALSERDETANICTDSKGKPEPDTTLRDSELVPLPSVALPLVLGYDNETDLDKLTAQVKTHIDDYMAKEVLVHIPDAWVDMDKTKVGYEIPINRHFYVYEPPRDLNEIKAEINTLEQEILAMLGGLS